jgi:hypothetical protein
MRGAQRTQEHRLASLTADGELQFRIRLIQFKFLCRPSMIISLVSSSQAKSSAFLAMHMEISELWSTIPACNPEKTLRSWSLDLDANIVHEPRLH